MFDKCNDALENRGKEPISSLNTIRNDLLSIENRWNIEVEQIRMGREIRYRYKDRNFSIFNFPFNKEDKIKESKDKLNVYLKELGLDNF